MALPKVIIEGASEQADQVVADLFKTIVCQSTSRGGPCCVALAGGTTPHPVYQALSRTGASDEVPWSRVEFFFGDERDVPLDHVESNYRMVQRALLDHVPAQPTRVHPMRADAADLDAAAAEYEQMIRRVVPAGDDGIPRFDLVFLGMGGDGHTASLFPGTDAPKETRRLVTACFIPVLGRSRMTITFGLINAARHVLVLVTGEDKAEAVEKLLAGDADPAELPSAGIDPSEGTFYLVLDAAAARLVRNTGE